MNASDEKSNNMMMTSMDTTESEMLVNALYKIQADLEEQMVEERLE